MKNNFEILQMPPANTNSVIVSRGGDCVIFDPWGRADDWDAAIRDRGLTLRAMFATHGHPDHISAAPDLMRRYNVPLYMAPADKMLIGWGNDLLSYFGLPAINKNDITTTDLPSTDMDVFPNARMRIIPCPGHTAGGVAYWFADDGVLLIGDTLFQQGIGRYDFPGGDLDALRHSIANIRAMNLPDDTRVIHGHGAETTIGWLKQNNPWFG